MSDSGFDLSDYLVRLTHDQLATEFTAAQEREAAAHAAYKEHVGRGDFTKGSAEAATAQWTKTVNYLEAVEAAIAIHKRPPSPRPALFEGRAILDKIRDLERRVAAIEQNILGKRKMPTDVEANKRPKADDHERHILDRLIAPAARKMRTEQGVCWKCNERHHGVMGRNCLWDAVPA